MSDNYRVTAHAVRSKRALASVAAAAIVASGALGATLFEARIPAYAQATTPAQLAVQDQAPITFADVVEKVKPAVVAVSVKIEDAASDDASPLNNLDQIPPQLRELFRRFGQNGMPQQHSGERRALGSGFFISADGYVVTNNHVVDHAHAVQITTDDGRTLDAKIVGTDPKTDVALLKVSEGTNFPFVSLARSAPRVGDWVVAIGNPFGLGGTVTAGIVSARGRDIGASQYDDFLQIDAPINKGNSGGPTFNLKGEVVGVNTAIFSPSGGSVGLAFAIPSETVQSIVSQLEKDGKVVRGYLGVQIQPLSKDLAESLGLSMEKGALVDSAQEGSPAVKAGLKAGDVITAVNGETVADARDLSRKIAALKPDTDVKLTYLRAGREHTASVMLGTLPNEKVASADTRQPDAVPKLGLRLAPASQVPNAGDEGVAVVGVEPDSPAAAKGMRDGDVILEVGSQPVSKPSDVRTALETAQNEGRKAVLMRVKSEAGTHFVAIALPKAG